MLRLPINKPDITTTYKLTGDLEIVLSTNALLQIRSYMEAKPDVEICLLAPVDREEMIFSIPHFYILEQEGFPAHTEIDEEATAKLIMQLIEDGKEDEVDKLKCWFHTHPKMGDFWSSTDDNTCVEFCVDWLVALVAGKGNIRGRVDIKMDGFKIIFDKVPISVNYPIEGYSELIDQYKAEAIEKVKEKKKIVTWIPNTGSKANDAKVKGDKEKLDKDKKKGGKKEKGGGNRNLWVHCDICYKFHLEGDDCSEGVDTFSSGATDDPIDPDLFLGIA